MLIEIHGGQFKNKGAEKMLTVTIAELSKRLPDARFVVDEVFGKTKDLRNRGLASLMPRRGWVSNPRFGKRLSAQRVVGRLLPKLSRVTANYATVGEVDALIDISGFAYTDEWGTGPCRSIRSLTEYYAETSRPIMFLPQALGPFRHVENIANFRKTFAAVNQIYARDTDSLAFVREITGDSRKLKLAPDITLFAAARRQPVACDLGAPVLFVPNIRMLRQGSAIWAGHYTATLSAMIDDALARGLRPQLMVHDQSGQDKRIAEEIRDKCRDNIEIIEENDPWRLKQRISQAFFVVGSRYHALVAGFSTGVPSIALGWSHKYPTLYRDFGQEGYVLASPDRLTALEAIDRLADISVNQNARESICASLERLAVINNAMWDHVVSILLGAQH